MNPDGIRKEIVRDISKSLDSVGIFYRIFSRSKNGDSLSKKLARKTDYGSIKKLQDLIGVRVVLYFSDDISNTRKIISRIYNEVSTDTSIDLFKEDEFKSVRYNIIYRLTKEQEKTLDLKENEIKIDSTFELQIRTVFSEGWHEVEHDLRYKSKSDWINHDNYSRKLNGVYATLETSEWTMIRIFEELAYSHYKEKNYSGMIRQKFRLRFIDHSLSSEIEEILRKNEIVKKIFRTDRSEVIDKMSKYFSYPLTMNNLIYFCNLIFFKNNELEDITPSLMKEEILELATEKAIKAQ